MTTGEDRAGRLRRRSRARAAALVAAAAAGLWLVYWSRHAPPARSEPGGLRPEVVPGQQAGAGDASTLPRAASPASPTVQTLAGSLQDREWSRLVAEGEAAVRQGPASVHAFVRRLFQALDALAPDDRLAVIYAFFESGVDVRFGRAFVVGPGGFLQDWPTLRVALLDYLAQRDGPGARVLAESLLRQRPQEPGEWTLALRELARGQTAASWSELITNRLHAFITDPAWAGQGEPAWLEGFDVVVAGRSPAFLGDLSALAGSEKVGGSAAQFAAFLAADRLVLADPTRTLAALNDDPALFAAQPNVRAGLFGRADVRAPDQLGELERYLRRTDISPVERESFAALFPLYDLAVSNNLLTPTPSRSMSDMLAHDRAAVARIDLWLEAPDLRVWSDALRGCRARIAMQIQQAGP